METDWEIEIGPAAPIIDATWDGFVDLVRAPERVIEIVEADRFPALAEALLDLNAGQTLSDRGDSGLIWTSKCDLWTFDDPDPYEMNARAEEAVAGLACYVDLLPRIGRVFQTLGEAEAWCHVVADRLRPIEKLNCRVDLVLRRAMADATEGFGVTAYLSACGRNLEATRQSLGEALSSFTFAVCN